MLRQRVHLFRHRVQGPARFFFLDRAPGVHGDRGGFAVHDRDLGGGRAKGEGVVAIRRRPPHEVVGGGGAFPQDHQHHGQVCLLYGVDQGLAQPQQLRLFRQVAHIDARGVLKPDQGNAVAAAVGDKLVHLDQALAIEFAPHARIVGVFRVALAQVAGAVAYAAHQLAVQAA